MIVQCRHIQFNHPGTDRPLFEDLNIEFQEPGLHAIFGPSGVGKSTLARMISGQMPPGAGEVRLKEGKPPLYAHNLERLPGWSSIGRHLERVTPDNHREVKYELVNTFGLEGFMDRRFDELSLGQQNRVNLVRYLVQEVEILLMDEILSNVDERLRSRILTVIKDMFPERMFIYISHNIVEVSTYCRDIWVLRGAGHPPQTFRVTGQDQHSDRPAEHHALQRTMLEIMNAA
jgi:ABC-type nitrate/sulfonate/bicarbonate transport system ATPase subunit